MLLGSFNYLINCVILVLVNEQKQMINWLMKQIKRDFVKSIYNHQRYCFRNNHHQWENSEDSCWRFFSLSPFCTYNIYISKMFLGTVFNFLLYTKITMWNLIVYTTGTKIKLFDTVMWDRIEKPTFETSYIKTNQIGLLCRPAVYEAQKLVKVLFKENSRL